MKIFAKRSSNAPAQNALPGVFALFHETSSIVYRERTLVAGYTAWAIFPLLFSFSLSLLSLSSAWNIFAENAILVLDILLGTWVGACLTLIGLSRLRKEELGEKEIEVRARRAMPILLYIFAFTFFCVIVGLYLLILPGVLAFIWLAFADIVALDHPGIRFFAALKKSKDLSKRKFFPVLWRLAMGNGLFGLLYLVLALVVLGTALAFAGIDPNALAQTTLSSGAELPAWIVLLLTALSLPFLPYMAVYNTALYEALKKA